MTIWPALAMIVAVLLPAGAGAAEPAGRWALVDDDPDIAETVLTNRAGMRLRFINLGATITAVEVPDGKGGRTNVVLGYGRESEYRRYNMRNGFGATIGRYAGRIARSRFVLDGRQVTLRPNNGPHALHGGALPGFDRRFFAVRTFRGRGWQRAELTMISPDGDQGFPGAVTLRVTYLLRDDNSVRIDYDATTTQATVLNLTNHSYFNLTGAGTIDDHRLRIAADLWVEADDSGIPTGRFAPVAGTPFDFRSLHPIGGRIDERVPGKPDPGYNQAWLLSRQPRRHPAFALRLQDPASRRTLDILTTEPSVQVYTGEYFGGKDIDGAGRPLPPRSGIALETQHLADGPNRPEFPTTVLRPGERFRSTTIWRFCLEGRDSARRDRAKFLPECRPIA